MSLTYTWKIKTLKKTSGTGLSDVIVGTQWQVTAVDEDGNEGKFDGATPFNLSTVNPDNFIAYEDLTEEIVLGWIKSVVVGGYWSHVNEQIEKQIELKKNPVVEVSELPWSPSATPAPTATPEPPPPAANT